MAKTKDIIKDIGKDLLTGAKYFSKLSYGFLGATIIAPTIYRKHIELERQTPDDETDYLISDGFMGGAMLLSWLEPVVYVILGVTYSGKLVGSLLAAQVTTNAVSGLYEIYRYKKNKIEEREKNSNLETKIEESQSQLTQSSQPQESSYKPLPDPWSIKTPEIKSIIGER